MPGFVLQRPDWLVQSLLLSGSLIFILATAGCVTTPKSSPTDKYQKKYSGFRYSKVEPVKQSRQKSCGAAALASVLNYWKEDSAPSFVEKEMVEKYPTRSEAGYPILQLREIALAERFAAFAVTMEGDPWEKIGEHVDNGRPVICAVTLPRGRYFGKSVPLVETFDRQTVMSTGNEWVSHYVVAMGRNYKEILLMDPKYGIVQLDRERFLYYWGLEKNAALICSTL